jgi:sugar phosphate isomerase/epimerase
MKTIGGIGFEVSSLDGEFVSVQEELHALAGMGADTVELSLSSIDLIAGGRIIEERRQRLKAATAGFGFQYTVHGLVSSNFMDPVTCAYQLQAAKALVQLCDDIGARVLVQHSGFLGPEQIPVRANARARERDALGELAEFARPYGVRIALENIFTTQPVPRSCRERSCAPSTGCRLRRAASCARCGPRRRSWTSGSYASSSVSSPSIWMKGLAVQPAGTP